MDEAVEKKLKELEERIRWLENLVDPDEVEEIPEDDEFHFS